MENYPVENEKFSKVDNLWEETHLEGEFDRSARGIGHADVENTWAVQFERNLGRTHCPDPPENIPGFGTLGLHADAGI